MILVQSLRGWVNSGGCGGGSQVKEQLERERFLLHGSIQELLGMQMNLRHTLRALLAAREFSTLSLPGIILA